MALLCLSLATAAAAGEAARQAILPPEVPWAGRSRELLAAPGDPWATPAEQSGMRTTPSHAETLAYLRRLAAASPRLRLVSIGRSGEDRELVLAVASREGAASAAALRANRRPTLLVQAGIHSGEIDGKDAGLMLLRDILVRGTRAELLDRANLVLLPIFNVDGHERASGFSRINQRGPENAGWRTTARNLNLNRDYTKLDAPEMRALVRVLEDWDPDLYVDVHVTDGLDYQYDVTYGCNGPHAWSPSIARFLEQRLQPPVDAALAAQGHIPGRLLALTDDHDPERGMTADWTAGARFSHGYGDARHVPSLLVENHALKPYAQRVLGTYVFLDAALRVLGKEGVALRAAIDEDRARRPAEVALDWKPSDAGRIDLLAVDWRREPSPISGAERIVYTGKPVRRSLPLTRVVTPGAKARRPKAYWLGPQWTDVLERLAVHGIVAQRLPEPREVDVEGCRLTDVVVKEPFEGRVPIEARCVPERRHERFPAGSARITTDQPLGDLAMLLLEPESPDSFLRWGFFLEALERTEYVERYVMEPMAERMLAEDPELKRAFETRLSADAAFAASPAERLQWFYERTPFFDPRHRLCPVFVER
jgi:hypothetical protein